LIIKGLEVGPLMANCYIVGCEKTQVAAVIDPGDEAEKILKTAKSQNLNIQYIINTHGHFDHVSGNRRLKEMTGARLMIHADDVSMLSRVASSAAVWGLKAEDSPKPDQELREGDTVTVGKLKLSVIHTPGHSPGGISLYTDDTVFVGDTLFAGSIGRTDFPGGDYNTLISSIREKLFVLGDNVRVFTGHGPQTTIGKEKKFNPFCGLNR